MTAPPDLAEVLAAHRRCFYPPELGGTAFCACNEWSYPDRTGGIEHHEHQAQAWRDACTITTVEQLDALPVGAVVKFGDGPGLYEKDLHGTWFGEPGDGANLLYETTQATLIWSPGWAR